VNVFLGLGLPWMIATIYSTVNGTEYKVRMDAVCFSGSLHVIPLLFILGLLFNILINLNELLCCRRHLLFLYCELSHFQRPHGYCNFPL
jgi:hypothetical protein